MQGQGTKLYYHDGAAFVQIANIMDLEGAVEERGSIERTPLDQASNHRKYHANILVDPGEVSGNILTNYQDTEQIALLEKMKNGEENHQWKIEMPDLTPTGTHGTEIEFFGHITQLGDTFPNEEDMLRPFTIKVSGEKTITDPDTVP